MNVQQHTFFLTNVKSLSIEHERVHNYAIPFNTCKRNHPEIHFYSASAYQRQKCRPMNLVSENIRFMRIFAGVPLGASVKWRWRLSTTAIFGDLGGYVFENVRDTASNNMWQYATPCRPANDCKMNDLEWLFHDKMRFWASASWTRGFECQK